MALAKGFGEKGSNGSRSSTRERRAVRKAASKKARRVESRRIERGE